MIGSTAGVQIRIATVLVDMRQGFDRLAARVPDNAWALRFRRLRPERSILIFMCKFL